MSGEGNGKCKGLRVGVCPVRAQDAQEGKAECTGGGMAGLSEAAATHSQRALPHCKDSGFY